jgi:hypothetical protein
VEATPSTAAIYSCLLAHAVGPSVHLAKLSTSQINVQDDYAAGYDAKFIIKVGDKDVGYATKNRHAAIIFSGQIYPLKAARRLLRIKEAPTEFDPFLAEWSKVSDASGGYLCASFPTGDLGQNGSFQKVRGGYFLQIDRKRPRALYFVIADTLQKNLSFTAARKLLLKEKWKPINVHAHDDYDLMGVEHELAKMNIREFDFCSIDVSSCIMRYKRGNECLTVFTIGEKIRYMKVVDWNNECPAPSPREGHLRQ